MAVARDLKGKSNHVIAVIGDGAMTGGQAYEAMNNAGYLDTNLIIILNDNKQVSLPTATVDGPAPPVGALSRALAKLQSATKFRQLREAAKVRLFPSFSRQRIGQSLFVTLMSMLKCVFGVVSIGYFQADWRPNA